MKGMSNPTEIKAAIFFTGYSLLNCSLTSIETTKVQVTPTVDTPPMVCHRIQTSSQPDPHSVFQQIESIIKPAWTNLSNKLFDVAVYEQPAGASLLIRDDLEGLRFPES